MTNKRNFRTRSIAIFAAVLTISITLASCGTVQTVLNPNKNPTGEVTISETEYLENFYSKPEVQPTQAPDPLYNFVRLERKEECRMFAETPQRTLDAELFAEAFIDGDIGGEDITAADEMDLKNAGLLVDEITGLPIAWAEEKFDPTKMQGTIFVDVLMNKVSTFSMPVPGVINSNFGWRRGRVHSGIDLDLETGDSVAAILDGIVHSAEYTGGYGNLVVLKHKNGLETYYAHLQELLVVPGQSITSGAVLGLGGSTGRSTGPHLHFEVRYMGAAFDPRLMIDFEQGTLKSETLLLDKNTFKVVSQASKSSTSKSTSAKKYYTVKKGDTLGKIAARNKTTVSKICKLNGISSKKILKPGMKLRVK
ncbi:MAG: peptidoglycan DD-metalloendopeptidase family protein [Chitinophagales bacterium]